MLNPILLNRSNILNYFVAWALLAGVHAFILSFYFSVELILSVSDSLVYNGLYSVIGIGIWYIVRFMPIDKRNFYMALFNHFITGVALTFGWLFLSYFILTAIFNSNNDYVAMLEKSLPLRFIPGMFFYGLMVMIFYLVNYYNDLQDKMNQKSKLEKVVKEAELNLLKSQINPHFLFNSLNSINALTMSNPQKASEMIIELSDFLRYSLKSSETGVHPLKVELENIVRYLNIEKIRFGNRLIYSMETDVNCADLMIPQMILQPLFENSVKHGVGSTTEPVNINVGCKNNNGFLELIISNNFSNENSMPKGNKMGLENIRMRLRLMYQSDGLLKINIKGNQFEVRLLIPQIQNS